MESTLDKLCTELPALIVKNIAFSSIGFMKKYFNEFSQLYEREIFD